MKSLALVLISTGFISLTVFAASRPESQPVEPAPPATADIVRTNSVKDVHLQKDHPGGCYDEEQLCNCVAVTGPNGLECKCPF
jgi:hypothetical protein